MRYLDIREWKMRDGDLCYVIVGRKVTCVRHDFEASIKTIRRLLPPELEEGDIVYGGFDHILPPKLLKLQKKLRR